MTRWWIGGPCAAALLSIVTPVQPTTPAMACERLTSLTLPDTQITFAQTVPAGAFNPPTDAAAPVLQTRAQRQALSDVPRLCRVVATLRPSAESEVKVEIWMPADGWNRRFQGVGNGGWAGFIAYPSLVAAVRRGYAAASTDTGHVGAAGDGSFALNHPEQVLDFSSRAVHEMTVKAKAVVEAYYGRPPATSYWNGCSTGGRQGLKEAQRYPADYDGIVVGAPANDMAHLSAQSVWVAQAALTTPAGHIPRDKYPAVHKAVLDGCDGLDGVRDGVLEDPTKCQFDPKVIQCAGSNGPACLTAAQVETARKIYAPARNPATGGEIFPGLEPGSELGWSALAGGPFPMSIADDYFKYVVFKNPAWDFRTLDFSRDIALADRLDHGAMNATDPNLSAFVGRGGKLLMYHGWIDQLIPPRNTINYYRSVEAALGGPAAIADAVRLFMVPGMAHCAGGDGAATFDTMTAIEQWVEHRITPTEMLAWHVVDGVVDRTHPLCAYPAVAVYRGSGRTTDGANYSCKRS